MSITYKTIKFLNENQIPIDVLDQPAYAYSKVVQWRNGVTPLFLTMENIFVYSEIFILSNQY